MVIKDAKSIEDYKRIRAEHIQRWIDARFAKGCITWTLDEHSPSVILKDNNGDTLLVPLDDID